MKIVDGDVARELETDQMIDELVDGSRRAHSRGRLEDEYDIYVSCMRGTGEDIKTFEEWLES